MTGRKFSAGACARVLRAGAPPVMTANTIQSTLAQLGYSRRPPRAGVEVWVRRKFNSNRAIAFLKAPTGEDPAVFARSKRGDCARAAGFWIPLFYGIGLQIVVEGPTDASDPGAAVDRYDNQWCVIQAIHIVDPATGKTRSASAWGQVLSGTEQAEIALALSQVVDQNSATGSNDGVHHSPSLDPGATSDGKVNETITRQPAPAWTRMIPILVIATAALALVRLLILVFMG